jgi:hypothetical protein
MQDSWTPSHRCLLGPANHLSCREGIYIAPREETDWLEQHSRAEQHSPHANCMHRLAKLSGKNSQRISVDASQDAPAQLTNSNTVVTFL